MLRGRGAQEGRPPSARGGREVSKQEKKKEKHLSKLPTSAVLTYSIPSRSILLSPSSTTLCLLFFFSLWILHCSSLFSTISQNWVNNRLCSSILKNMGGKKKNMFLLWEQSKVSLKSSPLIKLSCQKHINKKAAQFPAQRKWGDKHIKKKRHLLCKETVHQWQ